MLPLSVFINIPEKYRDTADINRSKKMIQDICIAIYGKDVEFVSPNYEDRDLMASLVGAAKLMENCNVYVKVDQGDSYDELYLALESMSRIYKDEFDIVDLTSISSKILPDLHEKHGKG